MQRVGKHYVVGPRLSAGSFGQIHLGNHTQSGGQVAVKVERVEEGVQSQLEYQAKLLAHLWRDKEEQGLPQLYYFGHEGNNRVMVMELLGPSLQELFQKCGRQFDLSTVVAMGIQIVTRLQSLHQRKYLHRDIKPQNFLLGRGEKCHMVHLIDFGLAKKFVDRRGDHIGYRDDKSLVGTPRYASINSHLGIEQSRRDDLEAVGYMLLYFLRGSLPWQNLRADPAYEKYEKILQRKLEVSLQDLTIGLPPQFAQLLHYLRGLHFVQTPNYDLVRTLLIQAGGNSFSPDSLYCWENKVISIQK